MCEKLGIEMLKHQKRFSVRWAFSSFQAINAMPRNWQALYSYFATMKNDPKTDCKEIIKNLSSFNVISELCLLYDILYEIQVLSQFLQRSDGSVLNVYPKLKTAIKTMEDMGNSIYHPPDEREKLTREGKKLPVIGVQCLQLLDEIHSNMSEPKFKGVAVVDVNWQLFQKKKKSFCSRMAYELADRFAGETLSRSFSINPESWVNINSTDFDTHGNLELDFLSFQFGFNSTECRKDFDLLKESYKRALQLGQPLPKVHDCVKGELSRLFEHLKCLPIGTADCERGFSRMNRIHSDERNRMLPSTVSNVLFLGINGPPPEKFKAVKYARRWLINNQSARSMKPRSNDMVDNENGHEVHGYFEF